MWGVVESLDTDIFSSWEMNVLEGEYYSIYFRELYFGEKIYRLFFTKLRVGMLMILSNFDLLVEDFFLFRDVSDSCRIVIF